MKKQSFLISIRVYFENTDAGGIVYHSQYLNFAERARTEFIRELGISNQRQFIKDRNILFVVKNVNVNYCAPAYLDDLLEVTCSILEKRHASIIFYQEIKRNNTTLVSMKVHIACINDSGKVIKLPTEINN